MTVTFTDEDRRILLAVARTAIGRKLQIELVAPKLDTASGAIYEKCGAFVTLNLDGLLRGCIGRTLASAPLVETVAEVAPLSAFKDSRFPPLSLDEFGNLEIEISVLTKPEPVESWHDIQIGRHGIILTKEGRSALFLPQVPTEYKWDVEQTLDHLALKAGLYVDDWRDGAQFQVFEAVVIEE
jgi:AmmeMemoRadiSam system protein A